ncbi:hypothetical protein J6590_030384 [Homalodisca vitripennis]|nr:hypothetical protein J6590_030384 [Homalodisca vitripennis]
MEFHQFLSCKVLPTVHLETYMTISGCTLSSVLYKITLISVRKPQRDPLKGLQSAAIKEPTEANLHKGGFIKVCPKGEKCHDAVKVTITGLSKRDTFSLEFFEIQRAKFRTPPSGLPMWEEVSSAKFLGILLDRGLTRNNHIDHVLGLVLPQSGIDCSILWANSLSPFLWGGVVGGLLYILETSLFCLSKCALTSDIHGYKTRGRDNTELEDTERWFMSTCLNRFPNFMKNAQTPKASKTRLKRFLVSKAFYSVDEFLAFNWETAQLDN